MKYAWRLLNSAPKKFLKKEQSAFLPENNDLLMPRVAHNFMSVGECERMLRLAEQQLAEPGKVDENREIEYRKSDVKWLMPNEQTEWIFERFDRLAGDVNKFYKYDLLGFFAGLQVATYEEGGHYSWHMDIGMADISHRKLSITVQLSEPDDYDGGELEFMCLDSKLPRERGTAIIFPSFLMHRVTPITRGCRRSIVSWISGTPFR